MGAMVLFLTLLMVKTLKQLRWHPMLDCIDDHWISTHTSRLLMVVFVDLRGMVSYNQGHYRTSLPMESVDLRESAYAVFDASTLR